MKFIPIIFLSISFLFSCQGEKSYEQTIAKKYETESLANFYEVSTAELPQIFLNKLADFDAALVPDSRIFSWQDATARDSLRRKAHQQKVTYLLKSLHPNKFVYYRNDTLEIDVSKEDFLEYYESISTASQETLLRRMICFCKFDEIQIQDEALREFVYTTFKGKQDDITCASIMSDWFYQADYFKDKTEDLDFMESVLDTLTPRASWGNHVWWMYILAENGRMENAYRYFKRLTQETIAQKDDPFIQEYGISELQNKHLLYAFMESNNPEIAEDFIDFSFELLRDSVFHRYQYGGLLRVVINNRQLNQSQEADLLELLKTSKLFSKTNFAHYYNLYLENVNLLKNLDDDFILNKLNSHYFWGILVADLSKEDRKYMDDFIEKYYGHTNGPIDGKLGKEAFENNLSLQELVKKYNQEVDKNNEKRKKGKSRYLKRYLNTPFDYDTIKTYFAHAGIHDLTTYEDFFIHNRLKDGNQIPYRPFNKRRLHNYIGISTKKKVEFVTNSLEYNRIIDSFSETFEANFKQPLHCYLDIQRPANGANIGSIYTLYLFTNNSKLYKIDLGKARDGRLIYQPILTALNEILKEEKVKERWVSASEDDHYRAYWLMEPAAFDYLDDKLGIFFP